MRNWFSFSILALLLLVPHSAQAVEDRGPIGMNDKLDRVEQKMMLVEDQQKKILEKQDKILEELEILKVRIRRS